MKSGNLASLLQHFFTDRLMHQRRANMPATVDINDSGVTVEFHRRAHLPIIIASGILNTKVSVPWWNGTSLRLSPGPKH